MAESSPLSNPNPVIVHQRAASIRAAGEAEDALVSEVFGELEVDQMDLVSLLHISILDPRPSCPVRRV